MEEKRDAMSRDEGEEMRRRGFLKRAFGSACAVTLVVACGKDLSGHLFGDEAGSGKKAEEERYDPEEHSYVYLIDISKCIGCGACVRACTKENDVPDHYFRTWVERYTVSRTGHIHVDSPNGGKDGFEPVMTGYDVAKGFFVPKLCNHCTSTPCIQLCPVGASYRSPDGVILVDEKRCLGCSYCVQACPFGSRFIHPETHTATKCTFCYHRITKGMLPACVQACPAGARMFGDKEKMGDKVTELIATQSVRVLKPEMLTEPNCYYMGMSREVQ